MSVALENDFRSSVGRLRLPHITWWGVATIATHASPESEAETTPLTELELADYNKCGASKRRLEFLAGRLAAKRAVSNALGQLALDRIAISKSSDGAPAVYGHPELCVSISHSAEIAIAMVAAQPIGIDLELEESRPDALARWFFGDNELRALATKHAIDQQVLINLLWTRKEAVSKVGRWGGKLQFKHLDCSMPLVRVGDRCVRVRSTRCRGYMLSVAYEQSIGESHG